LDLARRLLVSSLLTAAVAGTIGYVREHEGTPVYEASLSGQAREIGGVGAGRAVTERILSGPFIAERLRASGELTAPPSALRRAVRVDFDWPRFVIRARADSPGYAALLARSWAAGAPRVLARLLRRDPARAADELALPRRDREAVVRALRRERVLARQPASTLSPEDPLAAELVLAVAVVYRPVDLLAGLTVPSVPERATNRGARWHLAAWLLAGAVIGLVFALLSGATQLRRPATVG
jgi:hypothetical protein